MVSGSDPGLGTCLVSVVAALVVNASVLSLSTDLFGMVGYGVGCQEGRNKMKSPPSEFTPNFENDLEIVDVTVT